MANIPLKLQPFHKDSCPFTDTSFYCWKGDLLCTLYLHLNCSVIASHSVSPITLDSYMHITHPVRCLNQRAEEKSLWEACRASSCVGPGQLNFSLLLGSAPGLIKPLLSFRFPRLLRAKRTTTFACLDGLSAFFGPLNSRLEQEESEGDPVWGPHASSLHQVVQRRPTYIPVTHGRSEEDSTARGAAHLSSSSFLSPEGSQICTRSPLLSN